MPRTKILELSYGGPFDTLQEANAVSSSDDLDEHAYIQQVFDLRVNLPSLTGQIIKQDDRQPPTDAVKVYRSEYFNLLFKDRLSASSAHTIRMKLKDIDDGDGNPSTIQGLTPAQRKFLFTNFDFAIGSNEAVSETVISNDHLAFSLEGDADLANMVFTGSRVIGKTFTVEVLGPYANNATAHRGATGGRVQQTFDIVVAPTAKVTQADGRAITPEGITLRRAYPLRLKFDKRYDDSPNSYVLRVKLKDGHGLTAEQQKAIFTTTDSDGDIIPFARAGTTSLGTLVASDIHQSVPIHRDGDFNISIRHPNAQGKTFVVEVLGYYVKGNEHTAADGAESYTQQTFEVTVTEPVKSKFLTHEKREIPTDGVSMEFGKKRYFWIFRNELPTFHVLRVKLKDNNQGLTNAADREAIFDTLEIGGGSISTKIISSEHIALPLLPSSYVNLSLAFWDENAAGKTFTVELLGPYDEGVANFVDATNTNRVAASPTAGTVVDSFDITVGAAPKAKLVPVGGGAIARGSGLRITQGIAYDLGFEDTETDKYRVIRIKLEHDSRLTDEQLKALFAAIEVTGQGTTVGTPVHTKDHLSIPVRGSGIIRINFGDTKAAGKNFIGELLGPFDSEAEANTAAASRTVGTPTSSFKIHVGIRTVKVTRSDDSEIPQRGETLPRGQTLRLKLDELDNVEIRSHVIRVKLKEGHGLTRAQQRKIFKATLPNGNLDPIIQGGVHLGELVASDIHQSIPVHLDGNFSITLRHPNAQGKTFVVEILGRYVKGREYTGAGPRDVQQAFEVTVAEPVKSKFLTSGRSEIPANGLSVAHNAQQRFIVTRNGLRDAYVLRVKLKGNQGLEDAEDRKAIFGSLQLIDTADSESFSLVTSGDHASIVGIFGNTEIGLTFTDENAGSKTFTVELLGPFDEGVASVANATNAKAAAQSATAGTAIDSFDMWVSPPPPTEVATGD